MLHTIGWMCLLQLQAMTRPSESHYLWLKWMRWQCMSLRVKQWNTNYISASKCQLALLKWT